MRTFRLLLSMLACGSFIAAAAQTILPERPTTTVPVKTVTGTIDKRLLDTMTQQVMVSTKEVRSITYNSAQCTYTVSFNGLTMGIDIKAANGGVCVSKAPGPTIANMKFATSKACATSPVGCADMTGLSANTKFYVRAFYTITEGKITGTFYGNELSFTTLPPPATKQ
jgi:hypothetical protein